MRDEMLIRTHTGFAPWVCVRADHKKRARLNVMRHLIQTLAPLDVRSDFQRPDPDVLFTFEEAAIQDGRLTK